MYMYNIPSLVAVNFSRDPTKQFTLFIMSFLIRIFLHMLSYIHTEKVSAKRNATRQSALR
jgi:hypothetical protein